jgi:sugar phosphate permease
MGSGQLTGAALGSAVAGFAVDGFGPVGGFVAASIFAFLGMALAALYKNHLPDLRGRDATPLSDTEPVRIIKH